MEQINSDNITRNDLRIVVHGAVQMIYADGEVSYHEKALMNKIVKAANLTSAETVRLKEDIRRLNSRGLVTRLSSIDAKRLFLLMVKVVFYSDDDIAQEEVVEYKKYAALLGLEEESKLVNLDGESHQNGQEFFFKTMSDLRQKFAHISPIR